MDAINQTFTNNKYLRIYRPLLEIRDNTLRIVTFDFRCVIYNYNDTWKVIVTHPNDHELEKDTLEQCVSYGLKCLKLYISN